MDIHDSDGNQITRPARVSEPYAHRRTELTQPAEASVPYFGYFDHDSGHGTAARVIYTATEDGDHFIEVGSRGSASQRQGDWHLKVTEASAPYYDDFAADTSTDGHRVRGRHCVGLD